jgi:hypothetical protein
MYHEDRLGGGAFAGVWLSGAGAGHLPADAQQSIRERLGVKVDTVDIRPAAAFSNGVTISGDVLDALAGPVGALLADRAA